MLGDPARRTDLAIFLPSSITSEFSVLSETWLSDPLLGAVLLLVQTAIQPVTKLAECRDHLVEVAVNLVPLALDRTEGHLTDSELLRDYWIVLEHLRPLTQP